MGFRVFFALLLPLLVACEPQLDSTDLIERARAIVKLTDVPQLLRIATEGEFWERSSAMKALISGELLDTVPSGSDILDSDQYAIILKALSASADIPPQHKSTKAARLVSILLGLNPPKISAATGDITITIRWKNLDHPYLLTPTTELGTPLRNRKPRKITMEGESIKVSIEMGLTGSKYTRHWESDFPQNIRFYKPSLHSFESAYMDVSELLADVYHDLPQTTVAQLAFDRFKFVRIAAVENLTDQTILAKVALEDEDWNVRRVAQERLNELRGSENGQ